MTKFSQWLENCYIGWQADRKKRASVREFADWLGLDQSLVSRWMNGYRSPNAESLDVLAYKLKDLSCYEMLGYPTPDPLILKLKMEWDTLPEETQAEIGRVLEKAEKKLAKATEAPARLTAPK